jgi:hypothetical protein
MAPGSNDYAGVDPFGWSMGVLNNGAWYLKNANLGLTSCSWDAASNSYVGFAVDFDAKLAWCTTTGSTWFPSGAPNLGTGGAGIGNYVGMYGAVPAFMLSGSTTVSSVATANFGVSAFHFTLPAGFLGWTTVAGGPRTLMMLGVGQ